MLLSELLSVPLPFVGVAVVDPSEVELLIEIGCAGGELDAVLSSCHALLGAATTVDAAAISVAHSCTGAVMLPSLAQRQALLPVLALLTQEKGACCRALAALREGGGHSTCTRCT